ncbi:hypothetical protein KCP71_14885 [Salmonella enterica subsp. enterica]|nr:hypothetical protein KCP71_14885 [Salmonella enterica subsp. enterica]
MFGVGDWRRIRHRDMYRHVSTRIPRRLFATSQSNEVLLIPVLFCPLSLAVRAWAKRRSPCASSPLMVSLPRQHYHRPRDSYRHPNWFCQFVDEPFCAVVACGIAGVPVLSGPAAYCGLTSPYADWAGFTLVYASSRVKRIRCCPSPRIRSRYFREQQDEVVQRPSPSATGWYCWS